jgi:hypothetical protein
MEFDSRNLNNSPEGLPANGVYVTVDLKAFQLLSIVNASETSHKSALLKDLLLADYERFEISRLLIEIAVILRNDLDTRGPNFEGFSKNPRSIVGELREPKGIVDLTFREACNKIIHSEHINFDMHDPKSLREYAYILPIVYLYGVKGRDEWRAKIDVVKFVEVAVDVSG